LLGGLGRCCAGGGACARSVGAGAGLTPSRVGVLLSKMVALFLRVSSMRRVCGRRVCGSETSDAGGIVAAPPPGWPDPVLVVAVAVESGAGAR